jgi:hypothetical protein
LWPIFSSPCFIVVCFRLFKILDKVIHWIRLSTGQLLIQWTASQWIQLDFHNGWLAIHWIKCCPVDNSHDYLHFLSKAFHTKHLKEMSAKLFFTQFNICCDLPMIYDQSFCYLCIGAGNLCLHIVFPSHMEIFFLLDKLWLITHLFSIDIYLHNVLDQVFLSETF